MSTTHEVLAHWPSLRPSAFADPEVWTPLEESQASRQVDARSQASARVFTEIDGRKAFLESYLERKIQTILSARRDILTIEEQPEPVAFVDTEGKRRTHVFDFRVTLSDGSRVAIDVKVRKKVKEGFLNDLACIARQVDPSFAKGVILLTEEAATQASVVDGLILDSVKHDADYEAYAALAELVRSQPQPMTIRDLGASLRRETSGFRPVVRLIAEGFLVPVTKAPLTLDTIVRPASNLSTTQEVGQ